MEDLEQAKLLSEIDLSIPYRTALNKATCMLKKPYSIWKSLNVHEQHQLYFFIFEAKLPFSKLEGYRTDQIALAKSLFEELAVQKPPMVEMAGVKPASKTCSTLHYSQD